MPRPTPRSRRGCPHRALLPAAAWLLQTACTSTGSPPAAASAEPTLAFPRSDVVDQYATVELALLPGSSQHRDAAGHGYVVHEAEDPRQGCALLDATEPHRVVGNFAVPDDGEGFDFCSYLGGAPQGVGSGEWLLAGTTGTYCAYRVDELLADLREGSPPRCGVELPAAANPPGGAPRVVGWLSSRHVVLKTAFCCGSSKYHVVNLQSGHTVGLGMSFESQEHKQYPVLRPFSDARRDFWIVQRADDPQAEYPTTIATVPCGRVLEYLDTGLGAHAELRVVERRLPAGASLTIPSAVEPCPAALDMPLPVPRAL